MNTVSDDLNEFMSDDAQPQQSGGGMRARLEAALAKLRELESENATLKTNLSERTVSDVWKELGVPERFRKAYLGEKNADAIKAWWSELAPVVNLDAAADEPQETEEQREQREALQSFQQAGQLGISSNGTGGVLAEANQVAAKGRGANSADRAALYAKMGIPDF